MSRSAATEVADWEDTLPHFSVNEKGKRITARPLDAPGMLGLVATVTFLLWIPLSAAVAAVGRGWVGHDKPAAWQVIGFVLYAFVAVIFAGLAADEARDRIGQQATADRIAAIPSIAGAGSGLLIAAWRVDDVSGRLFALGGLACWAGAALVGLAAWRGLRHIRRRHAWRAALQASGTRSPGVLREVTFSKRWAHGQPQFRVAVEYTSESGPQRVIAHMSTIASRVPLPGAAMTVIRSPHDPGAEALIELDDADPDFDPDHAKYEEPTGN